MDIKKFGESQFKGKVKDIYLAASAVRNHPENPQDVSLAEIIKEKHNISIDGFLHDLGINPAYDSVENIITVSEMDTRWIIPEVFREALVLGYRTAPIWPNIIASEEQMRGLSLVMPHINMSEATPHKVNEGETIPLGEISYGSKQFGIFKIGRGIKITDEVRKYSSLNLVSLFLKDFGVKLGHATDVLAIDCLINGEQTDGSESAPVIGMTSAGTKTYADILRIWIRLSRIGRMPNTMIGGEAEALLTLNLTEFKTPVSGTPMNKLSVKTPVPSNTNYFIHGNIPANQEIILDPKAGVIKFNGWPLKVESERIVSNQTEAFYVSLQTGFAKMFRDAAIVMDRSLAFASAGFPTYLDADSAQNVTIS